MLSPLWFLFDSSRHIPKLNYRATVLFELSQACEVSGFLLFAGYAFHCPASPCISNTKVRTAMFCVGVIHPYIKPARAYVLAMRWYSWCARLRCMCARSSSSVIAVTRSVLMLSPLLYEVLALCARRAVVCAVGRWGMVWLCSVGVLGCCLCAMSCRTLGIGSRSYHHLLFRVGVLKCVF